MDDLLKKAQNALSNLTGGKTDPKVAVQSALDKTDLDEKMLEQFKGLLDKTDLDEKGLALIKKAEDMLKNPMFSSVTETALKKLNMTKEQVLQKIEEVKVLAAKARKQV